MKKPPPQPADLRVGFSFYAEDLSALRDILAGLRERHLRIKRTLLVRALAHVVPADEMFAHALSRHRAEQAGRVKTDSEVDVCLAFMVLETDVDKLERVSDQLADKQLRSGRSFILRSLLHAPWNFDTLARDIRKFVEEHPDPRTRAGRALRRD